MDLLTMNCEERESILKGLRAEFTKDTIVELIEMNDPWRNMSAGLKGIVRSVDDGGMIRVNWENGSNLSVVYGVDKVRVIETGK